MKNIVKSFIFMIMLIALVVTTSAVFVPQSNQKGFGVDYITSSSIFSEKKNTIDVIALGDSLVYSAITPMQLYDRFGYTMYVASTPSQRMDQSYEMLQKIYKVQQPKFVFLELESLYRKYSWHKDVKFQVEGRIPLLRYHNRWKDLSVGSTKSNQKMDYLKGYRYYNVVQPIKKHKKRKNKIYETNFNYLKKIMKLCKDHHSELVLMSLPCLKNWNIKRHAQMKSIAGNNYMFIDFNNMENFQTNWELESRDGGDHLNYEGAKKVTAFLGDYLNQTNQLTSHRLDKNYSNYEEALIHYKKKVKEL